MVILGVPERIAYVGIALRCEVTMSNSNVRMLNAGEQGLVVEFGDVIDAAVNARVHLLAKALMEERREGVLEVVPTYRSLFVNFNPLLIERQSLMQKIAELLSVLHTRPCIDNPARVIAIPVSYGGEFGPDIEFVAAHNGISIPDVIEIHSSASYLIYMLGFTPGFPYLGGMHERIATPRLDKPRVSIPAGSVGIGGRQTGIYPIESPGGWRLIGRTPLKVFDASAASPFLFAAGDYLQFNAISSKEYQVISRQIEEKSYSPVIKVFEKEGTCQGAPS
jgi:inhibitor of KinA